jgi:glutamine amidotransferase
MHNLERAGWLDVLDDEVRRRGKPFLGLCLGMQLLAERGTEYGDHAGLGWIPGVVERLPAEGVRVPHIGWNDVQIKASSRLGSGLGDSATFYFVHSYVLKTDAEDAITGRCLYGSDFPVMLEHENVFGTQFHPEKSQRDGLTILRNFARC